MANDVKAWIGPTDKNDLIGPYLLRIQGNGRDVWLVNNCWLYDCKRMRGFIPPPSVSRIYGKRWVTYGLYEKGIRPYPMKKFFKQPLTALDENTDWFQWLNAIFTKELTYQFYGQDTVGGINPMDAPEQKNKIIGKVEKFLYTRDPSDGPRTETALRGQQWYADNFPPEVKQREVKERSPSPPPLEPLDPPGPPGPPSPVASIAGFSSVFGDDNDAVSVGSFMSDGLSVGSPAVSRGSPAMPLRRATNPIVVQVTPLERLLERFEHLVAVA